MRNKKVVEINRFDNFNTDNAIVAKKFYNYLPSNELQNSHGVVNAMFPLNYEDTSEAELNITKKGITKVEGIAFFKQYFSTSGRTVNRLIVYGDDKKVYINQMQDDTYDLFWLYELTFNSAPITLAFKKDDLDAIILASNDQMKVWCTNYSPYTITNAPIITSMCMNEGVLFCTIKEPAFKVWYATDLDAENVGNISSTSGYISLEDDLGYARKIVAFNENVYVFRDYGISKINYIKKDISVSQIYLSNTKIYTNTVSVCGNNILFMTKEGLYSFNGVKVSKIKINIFESLKIDNANAVSASLGEKYYLALKLDFNDEDKILCEQNNCVNNALIIFDTNDLSFEIIRGVDIKSLLPVKTDGFEKMLTIFNTGNVDKIGEVKEISKSFDDNLPKYWLSDNLVKNTNTKLFTKLSVCADSNVKFKLLYDNKVMSFTTYKSGINEFVFKICCKDIKLEISSSCESAIVKNVSLDYYEY